MPMDMLDIHQVLKLLPHRYSLLLVDKVLEYRPGEMVAVKNVTFNEPFFQGHFPDRPIMPGVLIIEALAQVGGVLCLKTYPAKTKPAVFLTCIDNAKFRKPVEPGDQLRFEVE